MYEGIIVFKKINVGSKSEGLRPFLYLGKGSFLEVWKKDDNSLYGTALMPFDGKSVVVKGENDEFSGIFVINEITEQLNLTPEVILKISCDEENDVEEPAEIEEAEDNIEVAEEKVIQELSEDISED